jgi:hypothetical protein
MTVFEQATKSEETLAEFLHEKTDGLFLPSCHPNYCKKFHNCTAVNPDAKDCIEANINYLKSEECI